MRRRPDGGFTLWATTQSIHNVRILLGQIFGIPLSKIDVRELPQWPGRADTATVLAYRYLRPGYKLALEARRYDEAEVLQALIDNARLSTVVADDGQVMTELSLSIRNNGRQHLEIELPEKTLHLRDFAPAPRPEIYLQNLVACAGTLRTNK